MNALSTTLAFWTKFLAPVEEPKVYTATDGTIWASPGAAFYHDLCERKCRELLDSLKDYRELGKIRRELQLSQAELAHRAGVSKGLVCLIETGRRRMTDEVTERLWNALWREDKERKAWAGSEIFVRLEQDVAVVSEFERLRGK